MKVDARDEIIAIKRFHGGMENARLDQILMVWDSLTDDTKKKYLDKLQEERKAKTDAVSP